MATQMHWALDWLRGVSLAARSMERDARRVTEAHERALSLGSPGAPREGTSGTSTTPRIERDTVEVLTAEEQLGHTLDWARQTTREYDRVMAAVSAWVATTPYMTAVHRGYVCEGLDMADEHYRRGHPIKDVAKATGYDARTVKRRLALACEVLEVQPLGGWLESAR